MAIENSVSSDLLSTFVDNINIFDCRLSDVFIMPNNLKQGLGVNCIFHVSVEKIILFPHRIGGNRKRS